MRYVVLALMLLSTMLFGEASAQSQSEPCISVDLLKTRNSAEILERYCFPPEMLFYPGRGGAADGAFLALLFPSLEGNANPRNLTRPLKERIERLYASFSISVASAERYPPLVRRNQRKFSEYGKTRFIGSVFGMDNFFPEEGQAPAIQEFFRRGDDLITCSVPGYGANPNCTYEFSHRDLLVTLLFGRRHLSSVFDLRDKAIDIIEAARH
jgi:hypothetical protein